MSEHEAATADRVIPDPTAPSQSLERRDEQPMPLPVMSDDQIRRTWRVAEALAKSGLFKDARQAGQAFAKVLAGRDLGLTPFEAMSGLHVIEGKIEASSDLHATKVRQREGYDFEVYWIKSKTGKAYPPADDGTIPEIPDDEREAVAATEEDATDLRQTVGCAIRYTVDGEQRGISTWTVEDSLRANLTRDRGTSKSLHVTYPRSMYFARAMTNGVAWYVPETMGGVRVYGLGEIDAGAAAVDGAPGGAIGGDDPEMADVPWPANPGIAKQMRETVGSINALEPNRYSAATLQMKLGGQTHEQHVRILAEFQQELADLRVKKSEEETGGEVVQDAVVVEDEPREGDSDRGDEPREGDEPEGAADPAARREYLQRRKAQLEEAFAAGQLTDEQKAENHEELAYVEGELEKLGAGEPESLTPEQEEKVAGLGARRDDLVSRLGNVTPNSEEEQALSAELDGVEAEIREITGENPDQETLGL